MSDLERPPFPPDVRALVHGARRVPRAPAGSKERVFSRLSAVIPGLLGGGGGGGGEPSTVPPARPRRGWVQRLIPTGASFAAGAVVGGLIVASVTLPQRMVYVDQLVPVLMPSAPAQASAVHAASAANAMQPPPASTADLAPASAAAAPRDARPERLPEERREHAAPRASGAMSADARRADERALLDVARTALARSDGIRCLAALAKHEARYPDGRLSEEREAMAIQALALTQRTGEAQARAARFRERFPGSLFTPAVESSLEP